MSRTKQKLLSTESKRLNVIANSKLRFCYINCLKFKLLLKFCSTLSRLVSDYYRIFNLFKSEFEFEFDQVWVWVWSSLSLSLSLIKFVWKFSSQFSSATKWNVSSAAKHRLVRTLFLTLFVRKQKSFRTRVDRFFLFNTVTVINL
jgi:hypothetical protein